MMSALVTEVAPLGEFATWQAERTVGDHDRNTLRLRLDPERDATVFEPGMTVWVSRGRPLASHENKGNRRGRGARASTRTGVSYLYANLRERSDARDLRGPPLLAKPLSAHMAGEFEPSEGRA